MATGAVGVSTARNGTDPTRQFPATAVLVVASHCLRVQWCNICPPCLRPRLRGFLYSSSSAFQLHRRISGERWQRELLAALLGLGRNGHRFVRTQLPEPRSTELRFHPK